MELKILYDNEAEKGFRSGWGFSCLVDGRMLFDTGADVNTLLFNMRAFNVDLKGIRKVVFSHEHGDHIGGFQILSMLGDVEVYVLRSFSNYFKRRLSSFKNVGLREISSMEKIDENIFTTGELGRLIKEQSLIVNTDKGVVVITGCSHPGLDKIFSVASKIGRIHCVVGGFHGFNKLEILQEVDLIIPCHCTVKKKEILKLYRDKSRKCSAGCTINI